MYTEVYESNCELADTMATVAFICPKVWQRDAAEWYFWCSSYPTRASMNASISLKRLNPIERHRSHAMETQAAVVVKVRNVVSRVRAQWHELELWHARHIR